VAEIAAIEPDAVLVKGDLTADGEDHELAAFHRCYDGFGDRLHCVRGNHDAYRGQDVHAGDRCVDVPGARLLLLDTVIPRQTTGRLATEQLAWMEDLAAGARDRPCCSSGTTRTGSRGSGTPATSGSTPTPPTPWRPPWPSTPTSSATSPGTRTGTGCAAGPTCRARCSWRWAA
jgi:hypothetical protein